MTKSVTRAATATITKTVTAVKTTPTAARERKTTAIPGCHWQDPKLLQSYQGSLTPTHHPVRNYVKHFSISWLFFKNSWPKLISNLVGPE